MRDLWPAATLGQGFPTASDLHQSVRVSFAHPNNRATDTNLKHAVRNQGAACSGRGRQ